MFSVVCLACKIKLIVLYYSSTKFHDLLLNHQILVEVTEIALYQFPFVLCPPKLLTLVGKVHFCTFSSQLVV